MALLLFVAVFAATIDHATEIAFAADEPKSRLLRVAPPGSKPEFTLHDLDGSRRHLKQQAGRVVLVHFFATWCEPCREELSSLASLVGSQHGAQLEVLAINVAEVPARVRRFVDAAPVPFPILLDSDRAVTKGWGVSALPSTFVLDRALVPRLFVEGDLDWMRSDVVAALAEVGAIDAK